MYACMFIMCVRLYTDLYIHTQIRSDDKLKVTGNEGIIMLLYNIIY